jgi:hypothetical protein
MLATYRVLSGRTMVLQIRVKAPCHLLDGNCSAISPVDCNVIQIIVGDFSSNIAPKG